MFKSPLWPSITLMTLYPPESSISYVHYQYAATLGSHRSRGTISNSQHVYLWQSIKFLSWLSTYPQFRCMNNFKSKKENDEVAFDRLSFANSTWLLDTHLLSIKIPHKLRGYTAQPAFHGSFTCTAYLRCRGMRSKNGKGDS